MKVKISTNTKTLDLVRELKKLWNRKITTIVGALGLFPKKPEKRLELEIKRFETFHITALLKLAEVHRSVPETKEDLLSVRFQRKIIS